MNFFEHHAANLQFLGLGLMLGAGLAILSNNAYGGVAMVSFGLGGLTVELLTGHSLSEVNNSE